MTKQATPQQLRKLNPGLFQSDADILAQPLVGGREAALRELMEVINNVPGTEPGALVTGAAGDGKTFMLARATAEMRSDLRRAKTMLAVRLDEDGHEIVNAAGFWLEALLHLAHAVRDVDDTVADELAATRASLARRWDDDETAEHARTAVVETSYRLDRRIVLMVENLWGITKNLAGDDAATVLESIYDEPRMTLVATAKSPYPAASNNAWLESAHTIELEGLDSAACRRLWNAVSGEALTTREARPIEILTGGNARLVATAAARSTHRQTQRTLLEVVVDLIDDRTTGMRIAIEQLPRTARRIYLALLDLWRPSTAAEIAGRARMDIRNTSALLGRLVGDDWITAKPAGRTHIYSRAAPAALHLPPRAAIPGTRDPGTGADDVHERVLRDRLDIREGSTRSTRRMGRRRTSAGQRQRRRSEQGAQRPGQLPTSGIAADENAIRSTVKRIRRLVAGGPRRAGSPTYSPATRQ